MSFTSQAIGNAEVPYSYTKLMTDGLILGYQKLISPINQSSCSMYPTCSEYAKEAFRKNNLLTAWLKTSDRLIRCSNDPNKYSIIDINGMLRFKDPVNYEKIIYSLSNDKGYIPLFKGSKHSSKEEININADLLYEFANQLKYNGELDEAIIEYKRLISYYPDSIYRINSLISIFNIYYQQEKYIEAIKLGKKLINENNTDIKADVNFFIGTSYLKIKNYNLARQYLRMTREYGFKEISEKTHLIEGLSYILEEKWSLALNCFGEIKEDSNFYDKAQEFI